MIQIKSQEQLDELLEKQIDKCEVLECFVVLNFGCRSSKDISFTEDRDYGVFNYIDDSEEVVPHDKLMDSFPLGEAIQKGALYVY